MERSHDQQGREGQGQQGREGAGRFQPREQENTRFDRSEIGEGHTGAPERRDYQSWEREGREGQSSSSGQQSWRDRDYGQQRYGQQRDQAYEQQREQGGQGWYGQGSQGYPSQGYGRESYGREGYRREGQGYPGQGYSGQGQFGGGYSGGGYSESGRGQPSSWGQGSSQQSYYPSSGTFGQSERDQRERFGERRDYGLHGQQGFAQGMGYGEGYYGGGSYYGMPSAGYGSQYGYRMGQPGGSWAGGGEYGMYYRGQQQRRGRPPRSYKRSDERIHDELCEVIARESDIDASEVDVQVANGEVTLTGTVENRASKRELEDLAERVFGVNDVHNNLKARKGLFNELGEKLFGGGNGGEQQQQRSTTGTTTASKSPPSPTKM